MELWLPVSESTGLPVSISTHSILVQPPSPHHTVSDPDLLALPKQTEREAQAERESVSKKVKHFR